ncbi:MAG: efflux RND transporter periplasmic adaptor subunit [Minisyncoccia bacterium]
MNKKIFQKKIIIPILLILVLVGYFGYAKFFKKEESPRYILTKAEKGTILVSVSGSGQVSTLDQIDIKPKVSGEVLEILVDDGQEVKEGDLLLKINSKDYQRAIDNAQLALDNAKTDLENLKKNKNNTQKDLEDAYEEIFSSISEVFNDFSSIFETIEPIFTKSSYGGDQGDIDYYQSVVGFYTNQSFPKDEKENQFLKLKNKYQTYHDKVLSLSRSSLPEILEEWLGISSDLVKEAADLTRAGRDIISLYKEILTQQFLIPSISLSITNTQWTNLANITTSLDQKTSNLSSLSKEIDQLKTSISNYADSIKNQEKIIEQKEDTLSDAKEDYENCFIRAPFNGIVAKVNIKEGDSVSPATTLFNFISKQKIAEISLNEIDAAKVKVGQKATLTFDALPDLTLTGKVTEIDSVGTVSQGVVSYGAKITLDTDDERIKPGMSVTADIIVDAKTDVLVLPNSAVKSQGGVYYVELVDLPEGKKQAYLNNRAGVTLPNQPKRQEIEIGLSNDALTEVISGLKEGDIVVSSIIAPTTRTTQTQRTQQFQIPGMGGQMRMR